MTDISEYVSPALLPYNCDLSEFQIGKKIGDGGFGEVFLAVHVPTGKKVAIKKLFIKEMKGSDLALFRREAEILALIDNQFCLPFMGCTLQYPFTIITKHIPCGNLYRALKDGKPALSGTNKTIIAMGVARGMQYLHEHNIMHRDIKSLNILLDENLLPVICDFGLAKFIDQNEIERDDQYNTKDVGTPHWMAPELIESNEYSFKVDVYAFGMLCWEMLTGTQPFHKLNNVQISYAVCKKKERPAFPSSTPKKLRDFISRCWHQDPRMRPSFKEIFKELRDCKVMYADTDKTEIIKFGKMIKKEESKMSNKGESRQPPLRQRSSPRKPKDAFYPDQIKPKQPNYTTQSPQQQFNQLPLQPPPTPPPQQQPINQQQDQYNYFQQPPGGLPMNPPPLTLNPIQIPQPQPTDDFDNIVDEPEPIVEQPIIPRVVDYNIIGEWNSPAFIRNFINACLSVDEANGKTFFTNLIPAFNMNTPQDIMEILLRGILRVVRRSKTLLMIMIQSNLYYYFPFKIPELRDLCFDIFYYAVLYYPQFMSKDFLSTINPVIQDAADKMITLLILYFRPGGHQKFKSDIFDFMKKNASSFLSKCGTQFLQLYYSLFIVYPKIQESKMNDLIHICKKAITKNHSKTKYDLIISAYKLLCQFMDKSKEIIEPKYIIRDLLDEKTRNVVISYLIRKPNISLYSNDFINTIIYVSTQEKTLLIYLYYLIETEPLVQNMLLDQADKWLFFQNSTMIQTQPHFSMVDSLSILLLLLQKNGIRTQIANNLKICEFLSSLIDTKDATLIDISTQILLKLFVEPNFLENLSMFNYFKKYLTTVPFLSNMDSILNSLFILDSIGRRYFVPDFLIYVPYIYHMLETRSDYTICALSTLSVLTGYKDVCNIIKQFNYESVLNDLYGTNEYKIYVINLQQNLAKAY